MTAPLFNKLRAFDLRGPLRLVVGQSSPKQNVETLIDNGGLLLVRIPKGTLGEDTSRLLGALVIARVWQSAMKFASREEADRPDASLYVDEMHNYLALPRSFEDLLAEARGYRLSLVLAHQHMGQLPREMRDALGANARTKIAFSVSPEDARMLEKHFEPEMSAHDLSHLSAFQAACRPCLNAGHGRPFTFSTVALEEGTKQRAKEVRRNSADLFAEKATLVDAAIRVRHRNAASELLPAQPPEESASQYPDRYPDQYGEQHGARPRTNGSSGTEMAGQGH